MMGWRLHMQRGRGRCGCGAGDGGGDARLQQTVHFAQMLLVPFRYRVWGYGRRAASNSTGHFGRGLRTNVRGRRARVGRRGGVASVNSMCRGRRMVGPRLPGGSRAVAVTGRDSVKMFWVAGSKQRGRLLRCGEARGTAARCCGSRHEHSMTNCPLRSCQNAIELVF